MQKALGRTCSNYQHGRTGDGAEYSYKILQSKRCLFTTRIQRLFVPIITTSPRSATLRICSRSCTSSSLPTPPTTPTLFCRPLPSLSTRICKPRTGTTYLQISDQAIEPVGECRSNVNVFRELAERMGFADECFGESVDQMIDVALTSKNPRLQGIDRGRLEREGHVRLNLEKQSLASSARVPSFLPFAEGNFGTSSGKAELYSEDLKAQGLDPVVVFTPPQESRHSSYATRFPLEMLARKADNFLNSSFCNLKVIQDMEEVGLLEISYRGCPITRNRGWRSGTRLQRPRGYPVKGSSRRRGSGRSGFSETSLGQVNIRESEHKRVNLRKTYRSRQLRNVLFRLG